MILSQSISYPKKWKTYIALLNAAGDDLPVARVLNQDQPNFLEGVSYEVDVINAHYYIDIEGGFAENMTFIQPLFRDEYVLPIVFVDGRIRIDQGILQNVPIEIAVRQRGTAPVLLSAETNTTGDKVILTFDKKMSGYKLLQAFTDSDFSIITIGDGLSQTVADIIVNNEIVEVVFVDSLLSDTEYGVQLVIGGIPVESFDYGLLEAFENFPVKNNVI